MKLTETAEDILEAIYVLDKTKKVVRVKDIAKRLNVKMASVVVGLKSLAQKGLVEHEHYGYVELTPAGTKIAEKIHKRHQLLFKFFHETLGLPAHIADKDACRIEHYLSSEGLERIVRFIEFVESCPEGVPTWLTNFYYFLQYGTYPETCLRKKIKLKSLSELNPEETGEIIKLNGSIQIKQELLKSGFVPGARIKVLKKEPEKIFIEHEGKEISLDLNTANQIFVSLI